MSTKRKLAAIVFADIAGYTDKANQDEGRALVHRERVERLFKSCTLSHHGRVVKSLGDGVMLEFASAVDAVGAALDIQSQMAQHNLEHAGEDPVLVRVGVHVGDVVEEDDDLYGNAVNIASRVQNMAQPGGICISREVYVQIRPILKLRCDPVGGGSGRLPEPIEVFQIMDGDHPAAMAQSSGHSGRWVGAVAAIAVLAFAGYAAFTMLATPIPDGGSQPPVAAQTASAHRLLLPDWVTPGEEFELDAGAETGRLSVYCGNRKTESRIRGGKLLVKVPADLPTQQTTISVFREGESSPILSQMTQVIRSQTVAMNNPTDAAQPPAGESAALKSEPKPATKPDTSIEVVPTTTKTPEKKIVLHQEAPSIPGTGVPKPPTMATLKPVEQADYDKLVVALDNGDFDDFDVTVDAETGPSPEFHRAMKAVSLAGSGKTAESRKLIDGVRKDLKTTNDPKKMEIESILKSAEAMLAGPTGKGDQADTKWAEAFAFSVNNGTKNFPGIAMLGRLIQDQQFDEAHRALKLLRGLKLSEIERRSVMRLERRLANAEKGVAPTDPPAPASKAGG